MGKIIMVGSQSTKVAQSLEFAGASVEEIADQVALFMAGRGYRRESGDKLQSVYGRGSALGHAMLGPLVRRQKYQITIGRMGKHVTVTLAKGMTGWSGGIFSAAKITQELREVHTGLQHFLLAAQADDAPVLEPAVPSSHAAPVTNGVEQIRQLGELRDAGLLTPEEFATKKAELLSRI
jgi:hypothetical protein